MRIYYDAIMSSNISCDDFFFICFYCKILVDSLELNARFRITQAISHIAFGFFSHR